MSTTLRGHRLDRPEMPTGRLVLRAPPEIEPADGAGGVLMNAIPMLGSLGSIAFVATMGDDTGGRSYLAAGMFLVTTLGFVVVQLDRQRRQRVRQVTGARTAYLHHLGEVRRAARAGADRQRRALGWPHPPPEALPAVAAERTRVWERGPADPHFLQVRYGVCPQPLALELVAPEDVPVERVDPAAAAALHRLLEVHRVQADLPAAIDLRAFTRVEIRGPQGPSRALARALVCSAAAFHAPGHLVVAVLASEEHLVHWDWLKWLPHALSGRRRDAVGPVRLVSTSPGDLAAALPAELADRPRFGADARGSGPHVLLVSDGGALPPGDRVVPPEGLQGVTVLDVATRGEGPDTGSLLRLDLDAGPGPDDHPSVTARRLREETVRGRADQCDLTTAEALARRLAPLHAVASGAGDATGETAGAPDFAQLLALGDVRSFDPTTAWRPRPDRDRLRVPIGLGEGGTPVHLDLKESAQEGMGPHGLVVGATGSGKSELLRTLVLGLAMTHSPEQLNLVLVDFKGGATFAGMAALPHVSAVITNLARELSLVDRMQDALAGEMVRRQELLREAGNLASVRDHETARRGGAELDPLPSLLIVVDEFSELLAAKPEFIDLFVAIGRLGRSLGLHLLLASQRLEEGRLRGLESHLSYRIGLRTFSAAESRSVLGVPDAYALPAVPGLGYLRSDPATLLGFRAAHVSRPPADPAPVRRDAAGRTPGILPFTVAEVPVPEAPGPPRAPAPDARRTLLDVAVRRMAGHGPGAHQVWLPPLDAPDTLDRLMGDLAEDPGLGLVSARWRGLGGLVVPLGTVDRPREQRRDVLTVDLGGAGGHVALVGGPRSGKSTVLRTLVAGLALTTTPLETQVFVLDFGGGTFVRWTDLPHVAAVGSRAQPDVVRRIVAEVQRVVDRREAHFRAHGIDSIETYRARRAGDHGTDDGYGDVFLVVDGWSTVRAEFDDLEVALQQLATRGLTFGVHVVAGTARWADFRATMRDLFGTRLELRLGDPMDSEIDRRVAGSVPAGRPGRGLVPGRLHFLAALPRIDTVTDAATLGDGVDHLVRRVAAAWPGPAGPKLRLLPERIDLDSVRALAGPGTGDASLLLGIGELDLAPVSLDPGAQPHLLVLGDGQSGKSSVLRAYLREVIRTRTPARAQVVLVDYRRSLLGEVPDEYLLDYLASSVQAQPALADLARYLGTRLPGPDATPEQLRGRSWWTGAEVFVVVDDHDLVATPQGSPLQPLQPLLAQARDTGLHLVVARHCGGAARALHEPVLQTLRDLATPGLLLSGSPEEGPLIGTLAPRRAPPGRGRLVSRDGVESVQVAWTTSAG